MEFCPEFKKLIASPEWKGKYIGEGNPNAKILIVGQECALDQSKNNWELDLFNSNWALWNNNIRNERNLSYSKIEKWAGQPDLDPQRYNPFFPYKETPFYRHIPGGTTSTCYNYQKIINAASNEKNGIERVERRQPLSYYKDCFITELNDYCIPNHKQLMRIEENSGEPLYKVIERHIGARYDLIRNDNSGFFKKFKVVILATGHQYIKKLNVESMFGQAQRKVVSQASRLNDSDINGIGIWIQNNL